MNRIINPYNVVAFYSSRTADSQQCPLYAPPTGLNWQVNLASVSSFSLDLVNCSTADEIEIDTANVDQHCVDSDSSVFLTYTGGGLASTPDEGLWQYRLTVNNIEYWSHVLCVENGFSTQSWNIGANCSSPSGGDYTLEVFFSPSTPEGQVSIEFDFGTGYTYGGSPSGSFGQDDIVWNDSTVNVRMNVFQNGAHYYRIYQLGLTTSTPCFAISQALIEQGGDGINSHMCLEFSNANDMEDAGLLYAQGYTQKFCFKPHSDYPEPVNETTYFENGEGLRQFQSAAVLERINLDFYSAPDYLFTVLALVQSHSSISLTSPIDGGTFTPQNPVFNPIITEKAACAAMRMTYEANRVFVKNCEEDITLEAC